MRAHDANVNRLKWLHAFEATACHGSFTGAAAEPGVTPAAVGQLVRALGDWVGYSLLAHSRSGKARLTLVAQAQEALHDITHGRDSLESGLNKLRAQRARAVVVVTASQVLMMNWLMERLNRFSQVHENIDLRLNVTEKLMGVSHGEADIGIRCGKGDWPQLMKTWLMDEEAVLICSPRLLATGQICSIQWLAAQKLIHDDTPHPGARFPSWNEVLGALGAAPASAGGLHSNAMSAVILAALSGRGVAIVRKALVAQLIVIDQLRQLFPERRWPLTWCYYLVTAQDTPVRPEGSIFHDWLVDDVLDSEAAAHNSH